MLAAERGTTLRELVLQGLEHVICMQAGDARAPIKPLMGTYYAFST